MEANLMEETWRLLKLRHSLPVAKITAKGNLTLYDVSVATGIPFFWLRKFVCREFEDPGVNRIQKLYEYLSGKKLIS